MKKIEGYFPGFDGTKLFYRFFRNPASRDTLVILHGHGEHSGRYEKFSRIFKNENISLAIYDFRGHGLSEGPRVYVNSLEEYLKDVSAFTGFLAREQGAGEKVYLLGHSFGGLTAVGWALKHPEKIQALFLSSPCLGLKLPGFLVGLNGLLNKVAPGLCYQNPIYPPHLSHNPREIMDYKKDPLIQRKISVRLIAEVLSYMAKLEACSEFRFPFPVFILAAELEKVVDGRITRGFFEKIIAPSKSYKVFPGFYHEIFNELEQEKAFDALKECLAQARRLNADARRG